MFSSQCQVQCIRISLNLDTTQLYLLHSCLLYTSVCAFANDFDDLGGGYIVVGVDTDDKTGVAIRPVEGIPIEEIDDILQDMVGYNNKIAPY